MFVNNRILIGKTEDKRELFILPEMANRHGLITGASGSGKTITLKVMAESFADAGVPVFLADVKGDLAGTAFAGEINEKIQKRLDNLGIEDFKAQNYPVRFWDLYGEKGHHLRATIESVGSDVLSIILGLSEAQEGNLAIAFAIAKDEELPLNTVADLRAVLQFISENRSDYNAKYGQITPQSIGAIQRSLLQLQNQGADKFFGQPMLEIEDFFQTKDGRGVINILDSVKLFQSSDLYAAFLLWILNELFNKSPEVGDLDKPKLVFFFDEAHLLFNNMPSYRLKMITQIVKLIRSRGIGLYFISQAPTDIPGDILAQLGNRVQHALRAYTPADQKTVRAAADAFRTNQSFNTEQAILELGTGEALISFQNEKGAPEIVERATILPPQSRMGTITTEERNHIIAASPFVTKYDAVARPGQSNTISAPSKPFDPSQAQAEALAKYSIGTSFKKDEPKQTTVKQTASKPATKSTAKRGKSTAEKAGERFVTNAAGVAGREASKGISKGIGSFFKNLFK
ncbi:MAG: DUF853 domain-containing protein [Candidatus Saccharibacteria bacterium]|nr:DUF853 domain-containing protein [Candidatus Saccharibacteria bacterium]